MEKKRPSFAWKFAQVLVYLLAFACAVIASITFGNAVIKFDGRCPLYTDGSAYFTFENASYPVIKGVDVAAIWESKNTCDFATFVPVAGATFGFILAYFVIMFDTAHVRDDRLHPNKMSGLFLPLLFSSVVLAIFLLISSVRISNGTEIFCNSIQQSLYISCHESQSITWEGFPLIDNYYTLLLIAKITSWISTVAYLISIALLLIRCFTGVDYIPSTDKNAKLPVKKRLRRDSQSQLLLPTTAISTVASLEPLPGTSADVPQFVIQPYTDSSASQQTVVT